MSQVNSPLTRRQVETWVQQLAEQENLGCIDIQWGTGRLHGITCQIPGGYRITLGPAWLDQPDMLQNIAAHELGHVAGHHVDPRRWRWVVVAGFMTFLGCTVGFILCLWRHLVHRAGVVSRLVAGFGGLVMGVVAGVVVALVLAYRVRRAEQHQEFEADAWAAAHGYPLTREMVDASMAEERNLRRRAWLAWWPSHPTWEERFAHPTNQAALHDELDGPSTTHL